MASQLVYLNGKIIPAEEARLSVFDTGFLHGASVFTTLLAHNGRPFRLDRHLGRLMANAKKIGLRHDTTAEQLTAAVADLLTANALTEARIRITLSPGPSGGEFRPTILVTTAQCDNQPSWYEKGIGVIVSSVRQDEHSPLTGVKTGCYLIRVLARQAAAAAGADEALWFTLAGNLAEACYCNVFCVRDATVFTPPLDTPVLPGIVREAVIELCAEMDIPCRDDQPLTGPDVQSAEEMFLTASVAGVRPVVRVQRRPVGDEKPSPVTRKIMAAYAKLLDTECPPR